MKPFKVGVNALKQSQYQLSLKIKQEAFNQALEYCTQFVKIRDFELFQFNMSQYFKDCFIKEHSKDFSKLLKYEKMVELSGVELHKITALQKQFESVDIGINPLTLEAIEIPDFNDYIFNQEQIDKYKKGAFLIEKIKELEAEGIKSTPIKIQQAFAGMLDYNWSTQELTPNYNL